MGLGLQRREDTGSAGEGVGKDVPPGVATTVLGAWDGPEAVAAPVSFQYSTSHCHQQRWERTLCCRWPSLGTLTEHTLPAHSAALLHPPLAAEIHIAHVCEATFHRWYHTAVALESSHISEALHQLVSSPSAPGSRAGQRTWWSFCEASLSLCYAKS